MKISARGRYAVAVMVDVAKNDDEFASVSEISARQGIPPKYLEQIINKLVKANLLISSRGTKGGYKLSKPTNKYSLAEILIVTGDMPKIAPCLLQETPCPKLDSCDTIGIWETLNKLIYDYLQGLTLEDLINKTYKKR